MESPDGHSTFLMRLRRVQGGKGIRRGRSGGEASRACVCAGALGRLILTGKQEEVHAVGVGFVVGGAVLGFVVGVADDIP